MTLRNAGNQANSALGDPPSSLEINVEVVMREDPLDVVSYTLIT